MNAAQIEARRWFLQAQADMRVVKTLRLARHYAATCFHSQQAAEKALKAVLYSQGKRVVLGRSVRELARQCEAYEDSFAALAEAAMLLDQFYIPTRYPNGVPSPAIPDEIYTGKQAQAAQASAAQVLQTAELFLQQHTQVFQENEPDANDEVTN